MFEGGNLIVRQGIGLGDDGDEVDLGMQTTHDLDIERFQGVTGRLDEVDARVDAIVDDVHTIDLVLGVEIDVEPLIDVVDDGTPGLIVVDEITETGRVDDGQPKTDAVLLDVGAGGLDGDGLGDDVHAGTGSLLGRVERGVEERVDQGRLAQAGLTCERHGSSQFDRR